MQNVCSEDSGKVKIGGIKMSPELVLINLSHHHPSLLQRIAEDKINLAFLIRRQIEVGSACSFCVARKDVGRVTGFMGQVAFEAGHVEIIDLVATLSIFPHNGSLAVLGATVRILGEAGIPIHALCTSLSSLSMVIDHRLLQSAVNALQKEFNLPVNHSPFHSDYDLNPDHS